MEGGSVDDLGDGPVEGRPEGGIVGEGCWLEGCGAGGDVLEEDVGGELLVVGRE